MHLRMCLIFVNSVKTFNKVTYVMSNHKWYYELICVTSVHNVNASTKTGVHSTLHAKKLPAETVFIEANHCQVSNKP